MRNHVATLFLLVCLVIGMVIIGCLNIPAPEGPPAPWLGILLRPFALIVGLVAVVGVLAVIVLVSLLFSPRRNLPNCPRCRAPLLHELAEQCLKCGHEWCNQIELPKEGGSDHFDYDTEEEGIVDRWKRAEEPPGKSFD